MASLISGLMLAVGLEFTFFDAKWQHKLGAYIWTCGLITIIGATHAQ